MTTATAPSFVLVHGAFVDSSGWHKVATALRAAGADVVTPDNPGASELFDGPLGAITFQDYVDNINREIDSAGRPVILVGHSMGGMIITAVAEGRPADIKALVYLSAYLPADGESLLALSQLDGESTLGPRLQIDEAHGFAALTPDVFKDVFLHDASPEDTAEGMAHQRAQPLQPFTVPAHVTQANFGRVPRYYITTARDRAVGPSLQKRMYEKTPPQRVFTIDGGHASFFAHAGEVAADLLEVAKS